MSAPSFPSHSHSLLYPVHIHLPTLPPPPPPPPPAQPAQHHHHHHHHHMNPNVTPQPRYPSTCIPSLMPPGVDPTSVDFRTFFPYIPNEVKHRKRTSRHQLKVLEDVFRKDTKPNAVLRKKLAAELEMSPRAVQVWFQNRRAKEKALRKRVSSSADDEKPTDPPLKMSSQSRDTSPNESSNSSTATEKPIIHPDDDLSPGVPPTEPSPSPVLKLSCSPPLLPVSPPSPWSSSAGTSTDISPHIRLSPMLDSNSQDSDLYNTRRGSLPTMPSQPLAGPNMLSPPIYYPDRRKSMDVNLFRLMHHPFARIAKEKNEALYLPKSPLSPAGSTPAHLTRSAHGVGPIRSNGYSHPRPTLSHRASEPHVFASARTPPFPPVPESGPPSLQPHPGPSRRFPDNRLYAITSRTLSSPIPGPLPTPDFQFGDPSSTSPSNSSPPGEVDSPSVPLQSPDIAQLQRWSFPRSRETDQDTEDSGSYSGISRFGSVASITGSDSSAMYSDVSSCVAVDHIGFDASTRRGSCASGHYLETRLSALNVSSRSSQGSINEAQMNAALAYRDKLAQQDPPEAIGGYVSPASTASPGTSPLIRQAKESTPSGLRNEGIYEYGPLSQVPENEEISTARRGSIRTSEPLPHIYVQSQGSYPTPPSEVRPSSVQPAVQQQHYSHGGNFIPPSSFPHPPGSSFAPGSGSTPTDSSYQQQYPPEGSFQGAANTMSIPHPNMSRYAPPAQEYTYTAGHGQEPFTSLP